VSRILVVGASGTVGTGMVPLLHRKGHDVVRATSREPRSGDQVHLDLLSGAGRARAFDGVERAFLLSPPGHTNQDGILIPLIDAAKAAGTRKIVLMTAMGADAVDSAPLRLAERHLEASGLAYGIIRPNWFMQNFNTFWVQGIVEARTIFLPVGDARVSLIDARDIAAVAAELLDRDEFDGQAFDLTGAEAITHTDAARFLSEATGESIRHADIGADEMRLRLRNAGLPAEYAEQLLFLLALMRQGANARTTDAVARITGRPPIAFAQYALDYRASWQRAAEGVSQRGHVPA